MTFDIKKLTATSAIALSLLAAPAMAQGAMDWDSDADGALSQDEFNTGFGEAGAYGAWDGDADGMLSEDEFNAGFGDAGGDFSDWDTDADGSLNEEEWNAGNFGRYDADGSGVIEEPELGQVNDDMGDGGLFDI